MKYFKVSYRNRKVHSVGVDETDYVNENQLSEMYEDNDITIHNKKEVSESEYKSHQMPEMDVSDLYGE